MTKYRTKTALSLQTDPDKKPWRTRLVLADREVELEDGEFTQSLINRGAIVSADQDESTGGQTDETEPVELPTRPSNGATKAEWRAYLDQLKAKTDPEMAEPLVVPDNATRDEMIQIGDARVAEWNEV